MDCEEDFMRVPRARRTPQDFYLQSKARSQNVGCEDLSEEDRRPSPKIARDMRNATERLLRRRRADLDLNVDDSEESWKMALDLAKDCDYMQEDEDVLIYSNTRTDEPFLGEKCSDAAGLWCGLVLLGIILALIAYAHYLDLQDARELEELKANMSAGIDPWNVEL
eukprot:TRINITY_DN32927_c0_g1_i1.p1 TRINITY_DN32927_c0_g1~~TRINITY_DN32927_c0_g1_i1.p1  ORF type:complete len:166 (-),score=25.75 TRINITY_DN32927_c0_g1_i1:48-545(-)